MPHLRSTLTGAARSASAVLMALFAVAVAALPLAAEDALDQKLARVLPRAGEEDWMAVGWHHDLLAARDEAERTNKPVFMWLMDGNPLGGT